MASTLPPSASKGMRIGLWVSQILLAIVYVPAGLMKISSPMAQLAAQMPWVGDASEIFVRFVGAVDLAAGLGILLPALTRVAPRLTVWAGIGSVALQVCAICLHVSRGEYSVVPINALVIALSLFVAWGRAKKAPILARGQIAVSA